MTTGGKLSEGDLQGRDDQHAVDALRRGCDRRAEVGRERRRAEGPGRAVDGEPRRARGVGGRARLGRLPGRRPGHPLLHLDLPEDRRAVVHGAAGRQARRRRPRRWPTCWRARRLATTSAPIATRRRACASGAAPRSRRPTSKRCCRGSTGPTPRSSATYELQGGERGSPVAAVFGLPLFPSRSECRAPSKEY